MAEKNKVHTNSVSIEEYKKLKKWYEEEIFNRDEKIEELEKKNKLLIATALKQSEKTVNFQKQADDLRRKMSKPKIPKEWK